jgi:hypothetical protein
MDDMAHNPTTTNDITTPKQATSDHGDYSDESDCSDSDNGKYDDGHKDSSDTDRDTTRRPPAADADVTVPYYDPGDRADDMGRGGTGAGAASTSIAATGWAVSTPASSSTANNPPSLSEPMTFSDQDWIIITNLLRNEWSVDVSIDEVYIALRSRRNGGDWMAITRLLSNRRAARGMPILPMVHVMPSDDEDEPMIFQYDDDDDSGSTVDYQDWNRGHERPGLGDGGGDWRPPLPPGPPPGARGTAELATRTGTDVQFIDDGSGSDADTHNENDGRPPLPFGPPPWFTRAAEPPAMADAEVLPTDNDSDTEVDTDGTDDGAERRGRRPTRTTTRRRRPRPARRRQDQQSEDDVDHDRPEPDDPGRDDDDSQDRGNDGSTGGFVGMIHRLRG